MEQQIIQAIKDFNTKALNELLEDDKSYMNVTKERFINALEKSFKIANKYDCNGFDEVLFGICEHCNKGCEGVTFYSKTGCYLDLYIESKDGVLVDDIYICNKLSNIDEINKIHHLDFRFRKDEYVKFRPSKQYQFIHDQIVLIQSEFKDLKNKISLDAFLEWYGGFETAVENIRDLSIYEIHNYNLYKDARSLISRIDNIVFIKIKSQHAKEALLKYDKAETERDKLIWFCENKTDYNSIYGYKYAKYSRCISFKINKMKLKIDISEYDYVLDYFLKIEQVYNYFMDKYQPLPEHYEQSEDGYVTVTLENYLKLHKKHLDIVKKYKLGR
ncbi:hypothetical protein [Winogradskyella sp.]|uniref:hypothetical protein n=1 Tax=Winogradskyella sp. TaxID=1883156 RepID=UPI003AB38599